MEKNNDPVWEQASGRAGFKKHLFTYLIICTFLWTIWLVSGNAKSSDDHTPWPVWVMLWWGIALAFNFARVYLFNIPAAIEEEYKKLKKQP